MEFKRTNHQHINIMLNLFESEQQPFRKIHRMIDLFETIIKTHTAFIIGSYFEMNIISDDMKGLLSEGLRTPSLGVWNLFSRCIIDELILIKKINEDQYNILGKKLDKQQVDKFSRCYTKENGSYNINQSLTSDLKKFLKDCFKLLDYSFTKELMVKDFYSYFYKVGKTIDDVINMRNKYAHGATPSDEECLYDIKKFGSHLTEMLDSELLGNTTIASFKCGNDGILVIDETITNNKCFLEDEILSKIQSDNRNIKPNHIYIINFQGDAIDVFPILSIEKGEGNINSDLVFFNDLKHYDKKKINYLDYPNAKHISNNNIFNEFLSVIDIENWRSKITDDFRERIQELTENFKGRDSEKEKIKNFINNKNKGLLLIHGAPGIGKSALIAQIITEVSYKYNREISKDESNIQFVEYFIRRATGNDTIISFLDYMNRILEKFYKTEISLGDKEENKSNNLKKRLKIISRNLKNKKLVLLIDGLDEGISEKYNILKHLITETLDNIIIIYSSRYTSNVKRFYEELPIESRSNLELQGLSVESIRAILYDVVSKYELEQTYIETIAEKSDGNPLYIKMLCLALENGEMKVNEIKTLPSELETFYDLIIDRYKNKTYGDLILQTLYVLASAKDYLSQKHMELILNIDEAKSEIILSEIQEILIESDNQKRNYQLFHESFREYLEKNKKDNLNESENKIIEYCRKWRQYNIYSNNIKLYPVRFYADHLFNLLKNDPDKKNELYKLAEDKEYIKTQILLTNQYTSSFELYKLAMNADNENIEKIIELGIGAAELHIMFSNSVDEVKKWIKEGTINSIQKSLQRIKLYFGAEQFELYIYLVYNTIHSSKLTESEKKTALEKIILDLDKRVEKNISFFNWCNYIPIRLMMHIMRNLKGYGIDLQPFISRGHIDSLKAKECEGYKDKEDYELLLKFSKSDPVKNTIIAELMIVDSLAAIRILKNYADSKIVSILVLKNRFDKLEEISECILDNNIQFENDINIFKIYELLKIRDYKNILRIVKSRKIKSYTVVVNILYWIVCKIIDNDSISSAISFINNIDDEKNRGLLISKLFDKIDFNTIYNLLENIQSPKVRVLTIRDFLEYVYSNKSNTDLNLRLEIRDKCIHLCDIEESFIERLMLKIKVLSVIFDQERSFSVDTLIKDDINSLNDEKLKCIDIGDITDILATLIKIRKKDKASSLLREYLYIHDKNLQIVILSFLAKKLITNGCFEEAVNYSYEYIKIAHNIGEYEKAFITLLEICQRLISNNEYEKALELAEKISDDLRKPNVYIQVAEQFMNKGDYNIGIDYTKKALELIKNIKASYHLDKLLRSAAALFSQVEQYEEAFETLFGIFNSNYKLEPRAANASVFAEISTKLYEANNNNKSDYIMEIARTKLDKIMVGERKAKVLVKFLNEAATQHNFQLVEIFKEQFKSFLQYNKLNLDDKLLKISNILGKCGEFNQAMDLIALIKNNSFNIKSLVYLGCNLYEQGEGERGAKVIQTAVLKVKDSRLEQIGKEKFLLDIANNLCRVHYYELASELIKEISDYKNRNRLISNINLNKCIYFCDKDMIKEALELSSILTVKWQKSKALLKISNAYFKKRDYEKADYILSQAESICEDIQIDSTQLQARAKLSTELWRQGKVNKSKEIMYMADNQLRSIPKYEIHQSYITSICDELIEQEQYDKIDEYRTMLFETKDAAACYMNLITRIAIKGEKEVALRYLIKGLKLIVKSGTTNENSQKIFGLLAIIYNHLDTNVLRRFIEQLSSIVKSPIIKNESLEYTLRNFNKYYNKIPEVVAAVMPFVLDNGKNVAQALYACYIYNTLISNNKNTNENIRISKVIKLEDENSHKENIIKQKNYSIDEIDSWILEIDDNEAVIGIRLLADLFKNSIITEEAFLQQVESRLNLS